MGLLYKIVACHMIGDYVLQNDFLAKTKGENWWHLIAHCILYSVPFALAFGFDWKVLVIVGTHIIIDALKARWNMIDYSVDQALHFLVAFPLYGLVPFFC